QEDASPHFDDEAQALDYCRDYHNSGQAYYLKWEADTAARARACAIPEQLDDPGSLTMCDSGQTQRKDILLWCPCNGPVGSCNPAAAPVCGASGPPSSAPTPYQYQPDEKKLIAPWP